MHFFKGRYQHNVLSRPGIGLLCATLLLAGCATHSARVGPDRPANWAKAIPDLPGLPNLYQVTPMLYRSAQPSKAGLTYLASQQLLVPGNSPVKTLLSLRTGDGDDHQVAEGPSLHYEHIPFQTWHPDDKEVIRFLRITTTPEYQPVLVHCKHGADRTGMMIAIYRIIIQQWTKEAALQEMTEGGFGFHPIWQNLKDYVRSIDVESIKAELAKQEALR